MALLSSGIEDGRERMRETVVSAPVFARLPDVPAGSRVLTSPVRFPGAPSATTVSVLGGSIRQCPRPDCSGPASAWSPSIVAIPGAWLQVRASAPDRPGESARVEIRVGDSVSALFVRAAYPTPTVSSGSKSGFSPE